jgi:DNA (cytosine-5)-methyltransferase 1
MNGLAPVESAGGHLRELALFAGAGGGIIASHLLGWRTICAVENNEYAASVLVARQNDGTLPPFPIWADDIRGFDGHPWRGSVDVVSGGFPCTDISVAGKGAGIDGEHSGLWKEMARIIREVRPCFVFIENSPALTTRGGSRVLSDLASMGFDVEWGVLGADACGAWHERKRFWAVAYRRGVEWRPDIAAWNHQNRAGAGWDEEDREPGACFEDDTTAA